jgi:hypothetical protein
MFVVRTDKGYVREIVIKPSGGCSFRLTTDKADALRCEPVAATMAHAVLVESGSYKWVVVVDADASGEWDFSDDELRNISRDPLGYDTHALRGLDLVRQMVRREDAGLTAHAVEVELTAVRRRLGKPSDRL